MGKDTERITKRSIVLRCVISIFDRLPWLARFIIGLSIALGILVIAVNFKGCSWGDFVITVDDSEEIEEFDEAKPDGAGFLPDKSLPGNTGTDPDDVKLIIRQEPAPGAGSTTTIERDEHGRIIGIRKGGAPEEDEPEEE